MRCLDEQNETLFALLRARGEREAAEKKAKFTELVQAVGTPGNVLQKQRGPQRGPLQR